MHQGWWAGLTWPLMECSTGTTAASAQSGQVTSADSTSAVPMRWPLTLITAGQLGIGQLLAHQLLLTTSRQHTSGTALWHFRQGLTQAVAYGLTAATSTV